MDLKRQAIPLLGLLVIITACSTTAVPTAAPTPNIDATVAAAVQATIQASTDPAATGNDPAPTGIGAWNIRTSISPLDDSKTVTASLIAVEGDGTYGEPVILGLRCKRDPKKISGTMDSILEWHSYLGSDRPQILIRFDDADPRPQLWHLSADNTVTFAPSGRGFMALQLVDAERMVAQVTPYNENPITAVFDLIGVKEAVAQILAACET